MRKATQTKTLKPKDATSCAQKKSTHVLGEVSPNPTVHAEQIQRLFTKIEPNKIRKMMKDIKKINNYFREYVHQNRITTLKYEDLSKFTQIHAQVVADPNRRNQAHIYECIKLGMNDLKRRMQEYEVNDLQTQLTYCSNNIQREVEKLQRMGQVYEGIGLMRNPCPITKLIQMEENENGEYEYLNRNEIKKAAIMEQAELKFKYTLIQR